MSGVQNTLQVIAVVEDVAVRVIKDVKAKSVIAFIGSLPALVSDATILFNDSMLVLPELSTLTAQEVGQLGYAAYNLVTGVIAAAKA